METSSFNLGPDPRRSYTPDDLRKLAPVISAEQRKVYSNLEAVILSKDQSNRYAGDTGNTIGAVSAMLGNNGELPKAVAAILPHDELGNAA